MHIRTFRAANLQAALSEIRRQMGPDASVLHTRQVRDGWMGWLGRSSVEVTAGLRGSDEHPATVPMPRYRSQLSRTQDSTVGDLDWRSTYATSERNAASVTTQRATMSHDSSYGRPLPELLQVYFDRLIAAGVALDSVTRWMDATNGFATGVGSLVSDADWQEQLKRSILRELRLGGPIRTQPGDRRVVALVGPTGVGKTTTVAKLAAGFRLEARRSVGLLTIDTFRIAAVQQLKAYAEIMDLPMEVVESPQNMGPALDRLSDVDLVLIDTAGRSPRSDARIDQLSELLRYARPDETHLVLSATQSAENIASVINGFAPVRPTAVILTKLDEVPHLVTPLSALVSSDYTSTPLSYVTTGQQVPDDIELAGFESLSARLLPGEQILTRLEAA